MAQKPWRQQILSSLVVGQALVAGAELIDARLLLGSLNQRDPLSAGHETGDGDAI